jgi:GT2 family glycosyltransferase
MRAAGWILVFAPHASLVHLNVSRGGVRTDPLQAEYWRFRNTAYYVIKHRGVPRLLPFVLTFTAIAVKQAVRWRRPSAVARLLCAIGDGIRAGRNWRNVLPAWWRIRET